MFVSLPLLAPWNPGSHESVKRGPPELSTLEMGRSIASNSKDAHGPPESLPSEMEFLAVTLPAPGNENVICDVTMLEASYGTDAPNSGAPRPCG
jgi:hypothetical protein